MSIKTIFTLIFLFIKLQVFSQDASTIPDTSILLDIKKGKALLEDCSGSFYRNQVDSFWTPNKEKYRNIFLHFNKSNAGTMSLNNYVIQYIGIVINSKRYIYLNAFHKSELENAISVNEDLELKPVVVCGGGNYFWRGLFDISKNEFTHININAPK